MEPGLYNGFSVTVCDPREEYRSAWFVAGAKVLGEMPDGALWPQRTMLPRDMEVAQAKTERAVLGNDAGDLVCGAAGSAH